MIRVTVWNEFVQEQMDVKAGELFPGEENAQARQWMTERAKEIREVHQWGDPRYVKGPSGRR